MKNFDYNLNYLAFPTQFDHCANSCMATTRRLNLARAIIDSKLTDTYSFKFSCETAGSTGEWDLYPKPSLQIGSVNKAFLF